MLERRAEWRIDWTNTKGCGLNTKLEVKDKPVEYGAGSA